MKSLMMLVFTLLTLTIYSQTDSTVRAKLNEYNQLLNDSLITQADYDLLKERLLFPGDRSQDEPPVSVVYNARRKAITKQEYVGLKELYAKKVKTGKGLIIGSVFAHIFGPAMTIVGATDGKPGLTVSGAIISTPALPMLIIGIVKMSKNKSRLRKLDTDYQLIADR